jgi:xanthine dehydrogenase YagR molybdenum-binding subunit
MRDGDHLIGWGMATGVWEALYVPVSAKAVLTADGRLEVSSATADIGTGTYTIMTQIAAQTLGLRMDHVTFTLGDSSLPLAPVEGGSMTAASVGSAVQEVCEAVREQLLAFAQQADHSPLADAKLEDVTFADGYITLNRDDSRAMSIPEAMRHGNVSVIEEDTTSMRTFAQQSLQHRRYTRQAHSAVFAEVKVDDDFGSIQVTRVVSAVAGGRILNPHTARSQILGGVVWGIGMALEEESVIDQHFGRFMNHNLAEYHVPVNADVHAIDVIFVEEHDTLVNPLGVKGLGEIGLVGVAAAIANAVFHATGKRIRDLPITLDKLL